MSIDENDKLKMSKFRIRMAFFILAYTIRTLNRSHFLLFSMYLIYFDYFWLISVLFKFFSIKCTVNIWYKAFWILKLRFEYTLILFIQNIHLLLIVNTLLFPLLYYLFISKMASCSALLINARSILSKIIFSATINIFVPKHIESSAYIHTLKLFSNIYYPTFLVVLISRLTNLCTNNKT